MVLGCAFCSTTTSSCAGGGGGIAAVHGFQPGGAGAGVIHSFKSNTRNNNHGQRRRRRLLHVPPSSQEQQQLLPQSTRPMPRSDHYLRTTASSSSSSSTALFAAAAAAGAALTPHKIKVAQQSNNAFRGKFMLILSKLLVPPAQYMEAFHRIGSVTFWPEIVLIGMIANAIPIAQWFYNQRNKHIYDNIQKENEETETTNAATAAATAAALLERAFQASKTKKCALVFQQLGLLQATLYLSDVVLIFLKLMKFEFVVKHQAQATAGSIIFTAWLAYNTSRLKLYYLQNGFTTASFSLASIKKRKRERQQEAARQFELELEMAAAASRRDGDGGSMTQLQNTTATTATTSTSANKRKQNNKMGAYNRFANRVLDILIYSCAGLSIVEILDIQIGFAVKSVFGLGSFGTLVLSLASKDVAAEFVGGLMIQSSNFFDEGETVVLQDGTTGTVLKIGWLHTYIQKEDDYVVRVPNSQVSHQRIARQKRVATKRSRGFLK